jgi:hypothetical protein
MAEPRVLVAFGAYGLFPPCSPIGEASSPAIVTKFLEANRFDAPIEVRIDEQIGAATCTGVMLRLIYTE